MSDIMLLGVLRMPPELWNDDPIDRAQRHQRYLQAADRIEAQEKRIAELEWIARKLVSISDECDDLSKLGLHAETLADRARETVK